MRGMLRRYFNGPSYNCAPPTALLNLVGGMGRILTIGLLWCASAVVVAQSTAFTYQGRLTDGGTPATGSYSMKFSLYDTPDSGTGVSIASNELSVTANAGIFTTTLNFGLFFPVGANYYLEIGVRPLDSGDPFTLLSPRQWVTSTPYAIRALDTQSLAGLPASRYVVTNADGNVGIGTFVANNVRLRVENAQSSGSAIRGIDTTTGVGVYGNSAGGTGVYGESATSASLTQGGVYGKALGAGGIGTIGESSANNGTGVGVFGVSTSPGGFGVYARNTVATTGWSLLAEGPRSASFGGAVQIGGPLTKPAGSFKIDHPLDPANKYLYHSFVESPDMMNVYNGNITTDAAGMAVVDLPDWFEALNRDFRYQLTVIGTFAQAIVASKVQGNRFTIATNAANVEVSWQVTGIRKDAYANRHRIPVEELKPVAEQGSYLHPEVFGKSEESGLNWWMRREAMQGPTPAQPRQ